MMNTTKSKLSQSMCYLLVIPVLAIGICIQACSQKEGLPNLEQEPMSTETANQDKENSMVYENDSIDVFPEFKGGQEALLSYFKERFSYPNELKNERIEGAVYLQFIVDETGAISNVQSLKSAHPKLEAPAIAFIEGMPAWNPGLKGGVPVKVQVKLPIQYTMR